MAHIVMAGSEDSLPYKVKAYIVMAGSEDSLQSTLASPDLTGHTALTGKPAYIVMACI